jgi:hypothetical protein
MLINVSEAGRRGGHARAQKLMAKERSKIAREAAIKRWSKPRKAKKRRGLWSVKKGAAGVG